MTRTRAFVTVYLTLEQDLHDFNTLEILFEESTGTDSLENHFDNPTEEFRYEILEELRDTQMWKATLNNPEGPPFKVELGTITINTETESVESIDFEKTSHQSVQPYDLTTRDT